MHTHFDQEERHPFVIDKPAPSTDQKLSHVSIIEDLMDVIPYGRVHYHLLFVMTCVHGCFGLIFTSDAIGLSTVQSVYSMSDIESGGLISAIAIGICVMSPIAGILSDSVGRKKMILFGIVLAFLATVLKGFVPTLQWQITLRIFQGAACACVWIPTPVLMAEQMPKNVRGPLTILYCVGWPICSGISALIGWWLLSTPRDGWLMEGWQWYFFLSSLPLIVAFYLVSSFIYESPRFHANIGNHATSKRILINMYGVNGQKSPSELSVVSWINGSSNSNHSTTRSNGGIVGSRRLSGSVSRRSSLNNSSVVGRGHNNAATWSRLCCSSDTLILYMIWICIAGGSWGASFWMPTYVERRIKLDALNAIKATVGEPYIVHEMSTTTPYRLVVFQSLCDACGIALAALIVDKIGRKISIQLFFLISSISLLMLTMVTGEESVLIMSGLMQFAQAICWVVIALYTCEAFTTSVRTTAMGFANTFARIGAIGSPFICGYLIQEHIHAAMWFCSVVFFCGFLTGLLLDEDRTGKEMVKD